MAFANTWESATRIRNRSHVLVLKLSNKVFLLYRILFSPLATNNHLWDAPVKLSVSQNLDKHSESFKRALEPNSSDLSCDLCKKCFQSNESLNKHSMLHNKSKMGTVPGCKKEKGFTDVNIASTIPTIDGIL